MNKIPIIKKGYVGGMDFQNSYKGHSLLFLFVFILIIGVFFLALFLRLFQLTIVKGDYYRRLSEDNRIREVIIEPQRGKILDRKGNTLVNNTPANLDETGLRLFSRRHYEDSEIFAHIIGYRQAADQNDVKNDTCLVKIKSNDKYVDKVGKKGVEKLFECALRGKDGKKLIEMDARGKIVRPLNVIPPEDGQTVQLSVDAELQKKAYEQIKGKRGAVVGIKPSTGEVLILASTPSFNPQDFEDSINSKINAYFSDKDNNPLFNRSTEGTYPSGSTFKLVLATGALEEHTITEDTTEEDTGFIKIGSLQFANWAYLRNGKMDGTINVVSALKRSNDVYFYKIGEKLGPENLKKWAEKFGYNQDSKIGIEESHGTIPSPFWKEEVLKEKWYTGDTYNMSIGQGYLLATPLQVARATQAFANNGTLCQPTLLKSDSSINDSLFSQYQKQHCDKLPISDKTLRIIKEGMKQACAPGGTAWPLFNFAVNDSSIKPPQDASTSAGIAKRPIELACKTGTAEAHLKSGIPYAWFTVYAPVENPEIVLSIMIEEGGEGSDVAAPIAREILKTYFERTQ